MKRLNTKVYQGKYKIHVTLKSKSNIQRVLIWNKDLNEYLPPARGKAYRARRYEVKDGKPKRVRMTEYFDSLEDASLWQCSHQSPTAQLAYQVVPNVSGPLFSEVVREWKELRYSVLSPTTCDHYDQLLGRHFQTVMNEPISSINSKRVDLLIAEWKRSLGKTVQSSKRKSFAHELTLLGVILNHYREYCGDQAYSPPILKRHRRDIAVRHNLLAKGKDLKTDEFLNFREKLKSGKHGKLMTVLATVQFFEALRVSEAAALHWEDISFDCDNPNESKITVRRSIQWGRKRGKQSKLVSGFKNAKSNEGYKELPMFPEVFEALSKFYEPGMKGLIFAGGDGLFFEYRQLQNAYDNAFKAAGLAYSGTHVMRHGGCRAVYNETGDLALAAQLLGNSDIET